MWPEVVVIEAPVLDDSSSISEIREPVEIQAFIPKLSIEALDKTVFDRSAWPDESQLHTIRVCPLVKGFACELRSVVNDYPLRQSLDQPLVCRADPRLMTEATMRSCEVWHPWVRGTVAVAVDGG